MSFTIFQKPSSLRRDDSTLIKEDHPVNRSDYLPVFQGDLDDLGIDHESEFIQLQHIFDTFNLRHPANFASRSLSSGDVVQLGSGAYPTDYYLCLSFGWHKINFD